ncbi:MAG: cbb3-type cytochrome c oxidase subunit I [Cyclobacteriaceae bacterium]|nr:cbb3-type cytochrome c oxidase subunit I [Cyclobacteriaceae bacterium]
MENNTLLSETGIIITLVLIIIPVITALLIVIYKIYGIVNGLVRKRELEKFNEYFKGLSQEEVKQLEQRKRELEFALSNNELAGNIKISDSRGLIASINSAEELRFVEKKKKSQPRPYIEPKLSRLILWYLECAVFWLIFGTTVGEYVGIKFVAPDVDHISWLSFGRLRPVHTNAVFWGWASMAMMGLAYYVVPRISNAPLASIKTGFYSLVLINISVILGSITLMAGINNGGGEYREYIWPVMALFGIGIILSIWNFIKTIAHRSNKEIYVSNWYIISAMMFLLVIAVVAYWPGWQNGLGETIVQGYYMHQGVGMWFMLFNLGLMYYFLPQQLNKPIYSYSLGILAFWAQILFYTLIGTHHFIFSAIPWWLQTIAIVGSAGMVIPVVAGTTNFLMTFTGSWHKLSGSYTLPFYLIGIIFYFTGSLQGTAEAFRFTNLIWHFTDFTVAHSHLTMYGIITFMLWGFIYTLVPRLTGKEPSQIIVGAHFWLALIGLLFYTFPLMYGATLRGLMWMEGTKSFIESVELMAPFWLWRAIGGSLMWFSHILFAYNFYVMVKSKEKTVIPTSPAEILLAKEELEKQALTN